MWIVLLNEHQFKSNNDIMPAIMIMYDVCNQTNCMCDEFDTLMYHPLVLPPTGLSAVHTSTTIRVHWTPPTATPTGYEITYFAGAEDTTGTAVSVGGGSTDNGEIPGLSATVTYRVSIVSVNGATRSATTGPVLAARREYTFISSLFLICIGYGIHGNTLRMKISSYTAGFHTRGEALRSPPPGF